MRRRVLIVDDSPEDREAVSLALRRDPRVRYDITQATTGAEGLNLLNGDDESGFDILFLDYRLTDMNAEQFVERLTGVHPVPPVPIVLLTGSISGSLPTSKTMRQGVQDFFTKEEATAEVLARVAANAMERHKLLLRLVESERQAEKARVAAEKANRAKSQFLTLISHELRTPLTAILGFTDVLRNDLTAEDAEEMLDMMSSSGQHLAELLDDLIDIAKVESGAMSLELVPCNLHELFDATCDLMSIRAADKGLKLLCSHSPDVPVRVVADPVRLRQVLLNLLGNAIKFTENGEIRCRADWHQATGTLEIRVSDTGPGIPDGLAETLFTPFVQGAQGRREGIGLGLAISRQLARLMGGDLCIESTSAKGTTFLVTIVPQQVLETVSPPIQTEASPKKKKAINRPKPPNLTGKRLLIAEDTRANRFLIGKLLQPTHAEVDFAINGVEAVERSSAADYDLILMDMLMPEKDGFEATAELRGRGVTTTIIAFTAAATSDDLNRCREAGCDDVLTKPIDVAVFFNQLERLVHPAS